MGGRIWVESSGVPGEGSTFSFTIVARTARASRCGASARPTPTCSRGKRVLIVDDNATNRRMLVLQTRAWGMTPIEAASGGRGARVARRAASASTSRCSTG